MSAIRHPLSSAFLGAFSRRKAAKPLIALLLAIAFLTGGVGQGGAQESVTPMNAPLSSEDLADIARIEDYLNTINTMTARFIQMDSTGETSEGDFMLWRPGRLRIAYDPPSKVVITANGLFLVFEDTELDQTTHIPLISTPAGVLVDEEVRLNDEDLEVTGIRRGANTLDVSIIQRDDPYAGRITLVFTDRPLHLQRWVVLDAQGVTTNFALIGTQTGMALDPELFKTKNKDLRRQDR